MRGWREAVGRGALFTTGALRSPGLENALTAPGRFGVLGRVLINRDCSAIAGCRKRRVQIALDAQAIFRRRRHQPRRPPPAKIRPGSPAPTTGPGTAVSSWPLISPPPKFTV